VVDELLQRVVKVGHERSRAPQDLVSVFHDWEDGQSLHSWFCPRKFRKLECECRIEKRERPRQPTPAFFILHSHSKFLIFRGLSLLIPVSSSCSRSSPRLCAWRACDRTRRGLCGCLGTWPACCRA